MLPLLHIRSLQGIPTLSNVSTTSLNWLPRLHRTLEQLCGTNQVPQGVAIAWIAVESGGRLSETTNLDERGYFQLLPEESKDISVDHQRLSTDSDYSLTAGFRLIKYHQSIVKKICTTNSISLSEKSEFYWRLVKMSHSIGPGALRTLMRDAKTSGAMSDWTAFSSFLQANDARYLHELKHSPAKWLALIERMFSIGRPYDTGQSVS